MKRPMIQTPEAILKWFSEVKDQPKTIHRYLSELRQNDYAQRLNQHDPLHIILHALTTNNVYEVNAKKLKAAIDSLQSKKLIPVDAIIELLILALKLILKIIELAERCKKPSEKTSLLGQVSVLFREISGIGSLFINLPHVCLDGSILKKGSLDLSQTNLNYANFEKANLKFVHFTNSNLHNANFKGGKLVRCNMLGCDKAHADFRWADVSRSRLFDLEMKVDLKTFLQVNYPDNAILETQICIPEMQKALDQIAAEVESDWLAQHPYDSDVKKSIQRHQHHEHVARNIVKLEALITEPKLGLEVLKTARTHHYFTNQPIVKFTNAVNELFSGVHNLFHPKHHRETAIVGTPSQNIIIPVELRFEEHVNGRKKIFSLR